MLDALTDPYQGREQALAKHSILKRYLQALAFKTLPAWSELAYVDGFSGPWGSKTSDLSDTSFGVAIKVLRDAQRHFAKKGQIKTIRCLLLENDLSTFKLLEAGAAKFDDANHGFVVTPRLGSFEELIPDISRFVGRAFALVFVDPKGWTGYSLDKIAPLLRGRSREVLINFMYDFVNRAASMDDPTVEASLNPILGGPGWKARLESDLPRGQAVEKLFRDELKKSGSFKYVASTRIDRPTIDRPLYFLVYGTHSDSGLIAFREAEWASRRKYEHRRASAKLARKEEASGTPDLFGASEPESTDALRRFVQREEQAAAAQIVKFLRSNQEGMEFSQVRNLLLESYMLRETDVKNVCVRLAAAGTIRPTWKRKKPDVRDMIVLATAK